MKAVEAARERLAARHAGKIRRALRATINTEKLVRDWESSHPVEGTTPAQARAWVKIHAIPADKELNNALRYAYADAWVLGDRSARALLDHLKKKNKATMPELSAINWDNWKPGERAAAALLNPPNGLQALLASRMTVIKDINNTTYDRLGTRLADALSQGLTNDQTASLLDQVMNDPSRSLMIARTETARASSVAARNLYETSNVEYVEWLVAEGCSDCQENADASPIPIDATFPSGDAEPPAHPNCMCALAPYVVDTQNVSDNLDESFTPSDGSEGDTGAVSDLELLNNATSLTISDKEQLLSQMSFQRDLGFYDNRAISAAQSNALTAYTSNSYLNIQSVLREGKIGLGSTDPEHLAQIKQAANDLQTLIKSAPALENDLVTYRGVTGEIAKEFSTLQPGSIITDKGFSSTSLLREKAEIYAKEQLPGAASASEHQIILEILNPAGTQGVNVEAFFEKLVSDNRIFETNAPSTTRTQYEWLLPHGSNFEVLSNDGKTIKVVVR